MFLFHRKSLCFCKNLFSYKFKRVYLQNAKNLLCKFNKSAKQYIKYEKSTYPLFKNTSRVTEILVTKEFFFLILHFCVSL